MFFDESDGSRSLLENPGIGSIGIRLAKKWVIDS